MYMYIKLYSIIGIPRDQLRKAAEYRLAADADILRLNISHVQQNSVN